MGKIQVKTSGRTPRPIKCIDIETGKVIKIFPSMNEASREIGKSGARASISLVCQGYQNTAYGYKWEYAD